MAVFAGRDGEDGEKVVLLWFWFVGRWNARAVSAAAAAADGAAKCRTGDCLNL